MVVVPRAVRHPPAEEEVDGVDPEAPLGRLARERRLDLAGERRGDPLVGVDDQQPLAARLLDRRVLVLGEVLERLDPHAVGMAPRDLLGPVGRAGVHHHHDLVAEAEQLQAALEHELLVADGEYGRQVHELLPRPARRRGSWAAIASGTALRPSERRGVDHQAHRTADEDRRQRRGGLLREQELRRDGGHHHGAGQQDTNIREDARVQPAHGVQPADHDEGQRLAEHDRHGGALDAERRDQGEIRHQVEAEDHERPAEERVLPARARAARCRRRRSRRRGRGRASGSGAPTPRRRSPRRRSP